MVKYLTEGAMEWFNFESMHEVSEDDYSEVPKLTDVEMVELMGNIAYSETGDFDVAAEIVRFGAELIGLQEFLNRDVIE